MLNYRLFRLHLAVVLCLIFASSMVVGYNRSVELSKRKLVTTGDGSMVSAYEYFQNVVKQVGGFVAIRSSSDKDLRKINLPQSFVKGQILGDVLNNFCTVYKGFDYKFSENVVNIYPTKEVVPETRILESYDFGKGALYVSIAMYMNMYKPFYMTGYEEIYSETMGAALSLDYMISSHFSLGVGLHEDAYKTEDNNYNMRWEYYSLNLWFDYHYYLFGAHVYTGVGVGLLFPGNDFQDSLFTELSDPEATLDSSVNIALRSGVLFRLYKNFFFKGEFIVASKGFFGFTSGITLKL